jgi:hypothetical protein
MHCWLGPPKASSQLHYHLDQRLATFFEIMESWNIKCKFLVRVFAILTTCHTTLCLNGNPNKASQGYALFLFNWIKKKK